MIRYSDGYGPSVCSMQTVVQYIFSVTCMLFGFILFISMACIWELLFTDFKSADVVLLKLSFLHVYIKCWLFPWDQWPILPPYITFGNVFFNLWWLWFSYSGPWIWCGLHSFFAFCRNGMRRRKPVRRSTTRVKALSMGSKLQLDIGRWISGWRLLPRWFEIPSLLHKGNRCRVSPSMFDVLLT